jgi:CHASE2 domain-containing sensor protein
MGLLIHLIFLVVVAGTIAISIWLSSKYKERYAEFPWKKTALLLAIEIIAWILFSALWSWVSSHPWIAAIVAVLIIIVLLKRKKKEEQIL